MSKDGTRRHSVSLSSNGIVHCIVIDGTDYSTSVRTASLDLDAGDFPRLVIEPSSIEVERVDLEKAEVIFGSHVTDLLVALGWTPPPATPR